jgi:hypothetical protein
MKRAYVFLVLLALVTSFVTAQETREVKKTVEISKDGEVFIDTYKGSIKIETWDKPQVDIVARIEPDGWSRRDKEAVNKTEIDIDASSSKVRIKSDYDRLKHHDSWFFNWFDDNNATMPLVHYTISMPKTARLTIKDYKSDSYISNVHAPIDFNTYKGNVSITGLEGSINLETYKGKVEVDVVKLAADSRFETYKGDIRIGLARSTAFNIDTDFGRRADFFSDFDALYHSKRYSDNESSRGTVNGGGPMLRLSTEKGTYRLEAK